MGGSSSKATVGYKYYLGVHMALAHGPLDNINRIEVDSRVAWEGLSEGGSISINAPKLFGGDGREGGISGTVDIEMGESTQTPNSYLQSVLDASVPAFRGVAAAVLRQCYMGNNPYLKPWSFRAKRIQKTSDGNAQWYAETAEISPELASNTEVFCVYQCDAVDEALGQYEHHWPMDDPSRGSTVPAQFYRANGSVLNLEPSWGVGSEWGPVAGHDPWTLASVDVGTFESCNDSLERYAYDSDTFGNRLEYVGFNAAADPVFYQTHVFTEADNGLDFVIDIQTTHDVPQDGGGTSTYTANPRLTITPDFIGGSREVVFTGSFDGGNPSVTVPITNSLKVHVVTVHWKGGIWYEFGGGYYLQHTYDLYVDGESVASLAQNGAVLSSASAGGTFNAVSWWWAARFGDGKFLGLANDSTTNRHENVWLAVQANHTDYSPPAEIAAQCVADCADMNPAHIIRECLTNSVWGLGHSASDVDDTSFTAAADVMLSEAMGISILWEREMPIEDFVMEILRHIDAALYVSRVTGKFVLKLIRDDYGDGSSLLTLDETNVSQVSEAKRPAVGELISSITVNFWDRETGEQASLTEHNWPLRQIQGAENHTTIQYPGFTNYDIAQQACLRDLAGLSTPLLSCTITASREAAELYTGDAFILDWPDLDISNVVMRVNKMSLGDGRNNAITIEATEDVFFLPNAITGAEPEQGIWVSPLTGVDPLPAVAQVVTESPYYRLVQEITQLDIDTRLANESDLGYLLVAGGRQKTELNARIEIDNGSGYEDFGVLDFAPWAYLSGSISETATTITVTGGKDLDLIDFPAIAQIEDELIRIDSITSGTTLSVGRGILDTVPAPHAQTSPETIAICIWDNDASSDDLERTATEDVDVRLLTVHGVNTLAEADAVVGSVTFDSRAIRPYPPGDLEIDSVSYPEVGGVSEITWAADHVITWAHRDRLQQTDGNLWDYLATDIGPEAGTTYRIDVYSTLTDTTVTAPWWTVTLGSVNTYTMGSESPAIPAIPANTDTVHIKVTAIRDGYDSWQSPVATLAS